MSEASKRSWGASDLACLSFSRIPNVVDRGSLTTALVRRLDDGPGFAIITGVLLDGLSPEGICDVTRELLSELGEPLPQGPRESTLFGWLVQNEGSTKSCDRLDVHNDGAMHPYGYESDLVALLCVESALEGGESILVSTRNVIDILRREHPTHLDRLRRPFAFDRAHLTRPGQSPVSWGPVFEEVGGRMRVRYNRRRIELAPTLSGVPLTCEDVAALDALDEILARPDLQLRHVLSRGELLVIDNHLVLHGRSGFADDGDAGQQRCLVRVLLARSYGSTWR